MELALAGARQLKQRRELAEGAAEPRPEPPARPPEVLPIIVAGQFSATSLWFVGNAVADDLRDSLGLGEDATAQLTSAVQLGFIVGTLLLAWSNVADRLPSNVVFACCAAAGAALNLLLLAAESAAAALAVRALVGVSLAGIYPVGMRLAASWFPEGLGRALGWLVGALVLGTGFPHALKAGGGSGSGSLPWETVVVAISALAAFGGALVLTCVPEGPAARRAAAFEPRALCDVFTGGSRAFLGSVLGYWGHMLELYAFWAALPDFVDDYGRGGLDSSLTSFFVIGVAGGAGCAAGGVASLRVGSRRVAQAALAVSTLCCAVSPALFAAPPAVFVAGLVVWGVAVVADSPQLSSLTAQAAPPQLMGTALTIVTCIGFALTIVSIQVMAAVDADPQWRMWLLWPGPMMGLAALTYGGTSGGGSGSPVGSPLASGGSQA